MVSIVHTMEAYFYNQERMVFGGRERYHDAHVVNTGIYRKHKNKTKNLKKLAPNKPMLRKD